MERDSFIFYRSFWEALKQCPSDVRLRLYDAIADYALNFNKPEGLEGVAAIVFPLIEPQITANNKRYINGCRGGEYGKLGGAPKGNQNAAKATPNKPQNNPKEQPKQPRNNPKTTPNENVNVNENVNDNESIKATTLPTRTRTTKEVAERNIVPPTLEMVRARCLEMHYTFDPEAFHAYYETRGWMLNNRKKMKDWWAACVTWQKNEQERKQQKPNQYGSNNEDHPTNAELIRQTYELINEAAGKPDYTDALPF